MATMPEEIAAFVAALPAGVGGTVGTDIFSFKLPATPEKAVAILPYFPGTTQRVLCPEPSFERPRFQLLVRGAFGDDPATWTRAYKIHRALDVVVNATLSGTRYVGIEAVQAPFEFKRDENERLIVAANYEAWRTAT